MVSHPQAPSAIADSNVLLDIILNDAEWASWSISNFRTQAQSGGILINPIICAEISLAFPSLSHMTHWLDPAIFILSDLPHETAWLAAQAFKKYKRSGGNKTVPLPDFFIGAHAEIARLPLLTRDAARYKTYFPKVQLITPS